MSQDAITAIYGQGYKADLAREGMGALTGRPDAAVAKRVAEKLLSLAGNAEPGPRQDQERKFALRMLAQAHIYFNDPEAAQAVIAQLTEATNKMEPGTARTHELCVNTTLAGYAQLLQGNIENVRIAGEQIVESAARVPRELGTQMRSIGLTLQAYAYSLAGMGEIAEDAADEKLKTLDESFSDPAARKQAKRTALGLKVMASLDREDVAKARKTIASMQSMDPDSLYPQVLSGFADMTEGKYESAYSTALRICNQAALEGGFEHEAMILLRSSARLLERDNDYANYVAEAKRKGFIRKEDTTYDPIRGRLDPDREAQLQEELRDTIGQYARSRITKTTQFITPINADAARVVGLDTRSADERTSMGR